MNAEAYQGMIGVVLEKLMQTHKELQFHCDGLRGVLAAHTPEEAANTPELLTAAELLSVYEELLTSLERRMPGLKSQ